MDTESLALGNIELGQRSFECLGRERHRLGQRGMGMDGKADIGRIRPHLDGEADFSDQLASVGADHAAADDAMCLLVEQQLGEAFVAVDGQRAAARRPGK